MMLAAVLACRNQSSRLYGKPLQHLDVDRRVSILDYLVAQLRQRPEIGAIVLAASDRGENDIYEDRARTYGVPIIVSEATHARLGDRFRTRALGEVQVKGKREAVRIFAVDPGAGTAAELPALLLEPPGPAGPTGGSSRE